MPPNDDDRVGVERPAIGLDQLLGGGDADRVGVLRDDDGRRRVVGRDPVGGVEVEQVVERRLRALELGGVREGAGAVGRLAIERGPLVRVLAVREVGDLLEHERQPLRVDVVRDLVEVRRDLGVVRGDRAERVRGEPVAGVGAHLAQRQELLEDRRVVPGSQRR